MTNSHLSSDHFPCDTVQERETLDRNLHALLQSDFGGDFYAALADYQRILADNQRRAEWSLINDKLRTLFMCGRAMPLDGPMIGIPLPLRDSDFFRKISQCLGSERSVQAGIDPADYRYQLFGYFLLLDDDWERHRQAIGLDTINH